MQANYHVSTDRSKLDLNTIIDYLSNRSYWAKGRTRETIEKSIANSTCFGLYDLENKQVGFARVVTDFCVFAWLMDVFILEEFRDKGLGKMLMKEIIEFEDFQGIRRWGLGTRDAHKLYEKFGFQLIDKPENMMERVL